MKLLRFDDDGRARLGAAMDGGKVVPLDQIADRYPTMLSLVEGGDDGLAAVREAVRSSGGHLDLAALKLLAPIERPGKFLAIGMNYKKHLAEAQKLGIAVPTHQYWFNKQTSCIAGPNDGIEPGASDQLDYEVELAVIIGRTAKNVSAAEAPAYVFGYAVTDDVTARDWQRHSPTFTVGKSFDTHGPIGPWIVTADEIGDPHRLGLRCFVNDELRQDGNTSELIYGVWDQIEYLSHAFTLDPGDILATGTPDGVGVARNPPVFLQAGDVVRCEVDEIGAIENRVLAPAK